MLTERRDRKPSSDTETLSQGSRPFKPTSGVPTTFCAFALPTMRSMSAAGPEMTSALWAAKVGPSGLAVGIDNSEVMIAEAKKRSAGLGLQVEFRTGLATDLPFDSDSFDAT